MDVRSIILEQIEQIEQKPKEEGNSSLTARKKRDSSKSALHLSNLQFNSCSNQVV